MGINKICCSALIVSTFLFIGCSHRIVTSNNSTSSNIERLNISQLYSFRDTTCNGYKQKAYFQNFNGKKTVYYTRIDTNGNTITIEGDTVDGFTKLTYTFKKEIGERHVYWPNGNIKLIEYDYINFTFVDTQPSPPTDIYSYFPVGKINEYDQNGRKIKATDNEIYFLFSLNQVKAYLKKYQKENFTTVSRPPGITRGYSNGKGFWYLDLMGFKNDHHGVTRISLTLDGNSGKLLRENSVNRFEF